MSLFDRRSITQFVMKFVSMLLFIDVVSLISEILWIMPQLGNNNCSLCYGYPL